MYLGFKIEDNLNYEKSFLKLGHQIYEKNKKEIAKHLDEYLFKGTDIINADELENDWFPSINNIDVFLSHSHKDLEKAIELAGWLKAQFNLNVFIDSMVWGHANDLLKRIDDEYCRNSSLDSYNYELRNYSTSHVHMMLSMALTKMIDRSEIVIFMNTKNSIENVSNVIKNTTKSPWIYSELVLTNLIRKKPPEREMFKKAFQKGKTLNEARNLDIARDVSEYLNNLIPLEEENLNLWVDTFSKNKETSEHPLDFLYYQMENINNLSS